MIRIVDSGASGNAKTFGDSQNISLDRNIYKRLQESNFVSLGLAKEDKTPSMLYFIQEMEKINNGELGNDAALYVDNFLSTLGVTQYYPHKDNTYKGELNG